MKVMVGLFKGVARLDEIFQSVAVKFALLDSTYQQQHSPCVCRDFLGDVVWSKKTGEPVDIYGFWFNYKSNPCLEEGLRLSLKFPSTKEKEIFLSNLGLVHEKETRAGTALTRVYETQEEMMVVVEPDPVWATAVWKMSLYTFYLKVASYNSPEKLLCPEDKYISILEGKEDKLLSKVFEEEQMNFDNIRQAHNWSGFVSILKGRNPDMAKILGV